jgi:hypothetical protein
VTAARLIFTRRSPLAMLRRAAAYAAWAAGLLALLALLAWPLALAHLAT